MLLNNTMHFRGEQAQRPLVCGPAPSLLLPPIVSLGGGLDSSLPAAAAISPFNAAGVISPVLSSLYGVNINVGLASNTNGFVPNTLPSSLTPFFQHQVALYPSS